MTTPGRSLERVARDERVYRRLLVVYPPSFRHEYGDDMVQGFRDLMVFSGRRGVWGRTVRDLAASATREWGSWLQRGGEPSKGILAVIVLLGLAGLAFGSGAGVALPIFLIPIFVLGVLPIHAIWRFRRAWVIHRTTGARIWAHLTFGVASLVLPAALLLWMGEDSGYWIFITIALGSIMLSVGGLLWAVLTLFTKARAAERRAWLRPVLVLVPCIAVLGFIIGASYNSYRNSLGPPGDHSVANASADTRALWEAAGLGDLDEVIRLTTETCADPWVKFPVGNGRHNAKGWAETRDMQGGGGELDAVADHLGRYQNEWYDRCGQND